MKNTKFGIEAQSIIFNVTVELCAENCIREDSYLCRAFNFFFDTNDCRMYKENLVDKINTDLKLDNYEYANLYSRLYYEKDGMVINVEPLVIESKKNVKYEGGIILGVVVALLAGGFILGVLGGMVILKIKDTKELVLPNMQFVNPNYSRQIDENVVMNSLE